MVYEHVDGFDGRFQKGGGEKGLSLPGASRKMA
jgi:hypothetical protein